MSDCTKYGENVDNRLTPFPLVFSQLKRTKKGMFVFLEGFEAKVG